MTHIKKKNSHPWKWAKKINKIHLPPPCSTSSHSLQIKGKKKAKKNKTKKLKNKNTPKPQKQGSAFPRERGIYTEPLGANEIFRLQNSAKKDTQNRKRNTKGKKWDHSGNWGQGARKEGRVGGRLQGRTGAAGRGTVKVRKMEGR